MDGDCDLSYNSVQEPGARSEYCSLSRERRGMEAEGGGDKKYIARPWMATAIYLISPFKTLAPGASIARSASNAEAWVKDARNEYCSFSRERPPDTAGGMGCRRWG